jgi:hypothetical protein
MEDEIISEYVAVYQRANPTLPAPRVIRKAGWYRVNGSPYRKAKLLDMTAVLRKRLAEAPPPHA